MKYKNTAFYLVKSLFQSFNLRIHSAEARTAACTLTGWFYQQITNPLPPILWHKQTALQINRQKKSCTVGILCALGLCHVVGMSQSDNEMSTEVDVLDSPDLMLLCWISHSKSSQKAIFPY